MLTLLCFGVSAQTTIYTQNFNTGSAPGWTLNTTDMGGDASSSDNYWTVNNSYTGGTIMTYFTFITIPNTSNEPSGITGFPNSYYLHILSATAASGSGYPYYSAPITNCNFNADGTATYFAAQSTPIVTTGYTGVSFSFWWLCQGDAGAHGKVYYRTSASGAWTPLPGGPATYFGSSSWALQTVTDTAFDNKAFLEFGFQFKQDLTGSDPAFAIDDIKVTGTPIPPPPVASFSMSATSACKDSCITFTSTSTGTVDSVTWSMAGMTISTPHATSVTLCNFPAAGTDTMHLKVYGPGGNDSTTHTVTIKPLPNPTITHGTGHTLNAGSGYSSYQWGSGVTMSPIAGATNATYTYTTSGTYGVLVDSGGCYGWDTITVSTAGVSQISSSVNKYWITQNGGGSVIINALNPLDDNLTIGLFDITGKLIAEDNWAAGGTVKQINDGSIPPGSYILKLSNRSTSESLKWQKQ